MPTNFPTSVDNFTNPTANDSLNLPSHSTQHANANDAIEAIEGYLLNGGQGLTLVKKQTIGTAVSTVNVTGAFNATYQAYRIVIAGGVASASGSILMAIGGSGTQYYGSLPYVTYSTAAQAILSDNNFSSFRYIGVHTSTFMNFDVNVINPFLAQPTIVSGNYVAPTISGTYTGLHNVATSYTDFAIGPTSGTFTGGTIYVYGYGIGQ
jgi:hypothetical protein